MKKKRTFKFKEADWELMYQSLREFKEFLRLQYEDDSSFIVGISFFGCPSNLAIGVVLESKGVVLRKSFRTNILLASWHSWVTKLDEMEWDVI